MGTYEWIFLWTCGLSLVFSGEYLHRSYSIANQMGLAVIALLGLTLLVGIVSIGHSIWWQAKYNQRRRDWLQRKSEWYRRRAELKHLSAQKLHRITEVDDTVSEESYSRIR